MLKANDALLSARDVTLNLNGRLILDRVNLDVRRGEIVTVIGPNGAGKSTLVRVMLGLRPLTSGRIERRANLNVGYVPQQFPQTANVPMNVKRLLSLTLKPTEQDIDRALDEDRHCASERRPRYHPFPVASCSARCWRGPCCAGRIFWFSMNRCRRWISSVR